MVSTWDPASEELAKHFLQDEGPTVASEPGEGERRVQSLARAIQEAVEDWMADNPLGQPVLDPQRDAR